jgi:CheY-like chemotaxis protein
MRILIIEDNDIKYGLVKDCLSEIDQSIGTQRACSYQSGLETLSKDSFDFIILDMTLPVYDVAHSLVVMDVLTFGGELILRETERKNILAKFIVLSQYNTFIRKNKEVTFSELKTELMEKYGRSVLGCVRLDSSSVHWKNEITILIRSSK